MHSFELWQFGEMVAGVSAPSEADAMREIMHYAAVYSQDGPVEIVREGEKPLRTHSITEDEIKRLWNQEN